MNSKSNAAFVMLPETLLKQLPLIIPNYITFFGLGCYFLLVIVPLAAGGHAEI